MNGYGNEKVQSNMGGTSIGGPVSERPTPMMDSAMKRLVDRVQRLEQVVEQAASRFSPVLRVEPPATANDIAKNRTSGATSQFGSAVEEIARQIEGATNLLSSLIDRCEL